MRCLLDKVTARYTVQGLLKLAEGQSLTPEELYSLNFFSQTTRQTIDLFIVPPTAQVLQKLALLPHYSAIIHLFLDQVEVIIPTRYFKRWARRLRDYGFTREDAAVLALATFGTNEDRTILSMDFVITFDQPMINHWSVHIETIEEHLAAMQNDIPVPYKRAYLPSVLRPEQIAF